MRPPLCHPRTDFHLYTRDHIHLAHPQLHPRFKVDEGVIKGKSTNVAYLEHVKLVLAARIEVSIPVSFHSWRA